MSANTNQDLNIVAQALLYLLQKQSPETNSDLAVNNYNQTEVLSAIADLTANSAGGANQYLVDDVTNDL